MRAPRLLAAAAAFLCLVACAARPQPRASFHIADVVRSPGSWEAVLPGSTVPLYVLHKPFATADDIESASLLEPQEGLVRIGVRFKAEAEVRLSREAAAHQNQWVAVVVGGKVVSAPLIRGLFSRDVVVTVPRGHGESQALLTAFLPAKPGAKA